MVPSASALRAFQSSTARRATPGWSAVSDGDAIRTRKTLAGKAMAQRLPVSAIPLPGCTRTTKNLLGRTGNDEDRTRTVSSENANVAARARIDSDGSARLLI